MSEICGWGSSNVNPFSPTCYATDIEAHSIASTPKIFFTLSSSFLGLTLIVDGLARVCCKYDIYEGRLHKNCQLIVETGVVRITYGVAILTFNAYQKVFSTS